ncbi:helix-turn-helix transcriptional regulator [Gulbenkiania mobilis]|uniref:helix-turn-helix transcriptional regulator n=1 Tax=Gulbenkiania mobilis TaxID=397457 RepID=UPI0027D25259|nr:helix-turn-helix transcriptional regulator [Gulbenkiania mobilis]
MIHSPKGAVQRFSDITDLLSQFLGTADGAEMLTVFDVVAAKSGVIVDDQQRHDLAQQLRRFLSMAVLRAEVEKQIKSQLTDREIEIMRMLAIGCSNDEIAGELGIKQRTVRQHIENMQLKLGVQGRGRLVALAYGLEVLSASA